MLHVRTFGGLSVAADGVPVGGAGHQRKTMALLALLATAGLRGVSRDKLIAYLWPDADEEHGRGLLKQAFYALRRDLHAPDLFLRATELRLNPTVVTSDIQLFEIALDRGDLSGAVSLYQGPFLDGFYLSDSPEFEHWVEAERDQLRRRVGDALEKLAAEVAAQGDNRSAVDYWRWVSRLDPLNSRVALGLMQALVEAGDPAGALEVAHEHDALLREELEVGPDAAVVDLAGRLRTQAAEPRPVPQPGRENDPTSAAEVNDGETQPVARRRVTPLAGKLALGALVAVLVAAALLSRSGRVRGLDPNLVAVAPFEVLAVNAEPWKEGLVTVLSGSLDGPGPLRAVAPSIVVRNWRGRADRVSAADLGRRTGARFVLYGALLGAGRDSVRLTATLVDAASGATLAEIAYRDAAHQVDRLTDSVAGAVLRELGQPNSSTRARVVTFNVLGPEGRSSICGHLPKASVVPARLMRTTSPVQGTFDAFACPESQLRLRSDTGTWYLRIELPATPALGALPWKHLETVPVLVQDRDVSRDVVIRPGSQLAGRATFDGRPVPGVGLTLGYDSLGILTTYGTSRPDGHWVEFLGRTPVILQTGVRYTFSSTCLFLGAKLVNRLPPEGSLFPSEFRSLDCTLVTGSAGRFTHDRTRLVVTPMPGEIGGMSDDFVHDLGYGWGVQFPIAPGQAPSHNQWNSHVWQGGLLIGVAPGRVLSGVSMRGQGACGTDCRDLGLDGQMHFKVSPGLGKEVTWRYSDARSREGLGLRVVQQSFDGQPPADYVLFRFTITSGGPSKVSFHAGFFADWDIAVDANDDIGFTDMNGRLMYQTNGIGRDSKDPYIGTLIVSDASISGNFFFRKETILSLTEQVDALAGRVVQPRSDVAGDNRYIHGAGPFTLGQEESAELWVAVVAGETRDQLLANTAAAAQDIANRRGEKVQDISLDQ